MAFQPVFATKMTQIGVQLPYELIHRLNEYAHLLGANTGQVARAALKKGLEAGLSQEEVDAIRRQKVS